MEFGFWGDVYTSSVYKQIERMYKPEIISEYYISDMVIHGDRFLIKWEKRLRPLTAEQLQEIYG